MRLGGLWSRTGVAWAAVAVLALCCAESAAAAPGDLDTTFGQGGVATVDLHRTAFGQAMTVLPDGRILIAGSAVSVSGAVDDMFVARFTATGALDTTFNAGAGVDQPDFGHGENGYSMAVQSNGGILVAGDGVDFMISQFFLTRFNADGTLDTAFGSGGTQIDGIGSADDLFGRGLAIQPNGNMVLVGYDSMDAIIEGLDSNGVAPNTGHDAEFLGAGTGQLDAVAIDPDGFAVAVGSAGTSPSNMEVARDTNIKTISFGANTSGSAIAVLPNGKILVAGVTDVGGTDDFAIARLNGDLSMDTTFGTSGKVIVDLGGSDNATAIAVQPDGKIVVAGNTSSSGETGIGVVRLTANGARDPTFGTNGVSIIKIANTTLGGYGVGFQANGDIIVGGHITPKGSSTTNMLALRLHGDKTGNPSSGGSSGSGSGGDTGTSAPVVKPTLGAWKIKNSTFKAGSSKPALNPAKVPAKAMVATFSLNETAKLSIALARTERGQLVKGKCVAARKGTRITHSCMRHVALATLHYTGRKGTNQFVFDGRLGTGRKLGAGTYTFAITATAGGKHVTSGLKTFHISST